MSTPRRATSSPTSYEVEPQRDNEVIVKFKIIEHAPVTRSPHHVRRQPPRPRRRAARRHVHRAGRLLRVRLRRPVPPGRLRARRPHDQRHSITTRATCRCRSATPRVMLTPDRDGIEITLTITRGPALQDPPAQDLRARRRREGGRAARRAPRTPRSWSAPRAATTSTAPSSRRICRRSARCTATPATPTSRPSPQTELDPDKQRGRHHRPDPPRTARLLRAHRDQGQHQDARQGHPPRDGDRGGPALQRDQARDIASSRITALGYFERVDVSTEQGSTPETHQRQLRGRRSAPPARSRSAPASRASRTSSPPRRSSRRTCSATASRSRLQAQVSGLRQLDQHPLLRAVLPRLGLARSSVELYDQLLVYPDFAQTDARRRAHVRLRAHRSRGSRIGVTVHRASTTVVDTQQVNTFFGHLERGRASSSGCRSRTSSTPGCTISLRPAHHLRHAEQPPLPVERHLPPGLDRARVAARSAARSSSSATALTGRFYYPLFGRASSRLRFILKLNNEVGVVTSPRAEGVPIFARFFLGGILDVRGLPPAHASARACRSTRRSTPTRRRSRTARTSAATSVLLRTSSSSSRSSTRSASAASSSSTPATRGTSSSSYCKTAPAPHVLGHRAPASTAAASVNLRTSYGLRHPLVLAARPAPLRVGLPAQPAPVRRDERLRVHDRQLLLRSDP